MTDRRDFLRTATLGLAAAASTPGEGPRDDAPIRKSPKAQANILIGLVGDLRVDRDDPEGVFAEVKDVLRAPDLLYGNLEGPYSDNPHLAPSAGLQVNAAAHNLKAYSAVGFDVL